MDMDVIIGFETHVELKTKSKLFCGCPVTALAPPNSNICPVCTGQPGALPVLNKKAVQLAVRAGLALDCTINRTSRFARKNYFYPDLPKGYQISQYELPFCQEGRLEITGDDGKPYPVGIKRIHLEEDAGKLVHASDALESAGFALVDYNRASVPLLEIVTDHERNPIRSTQEARAYLEKLILILRYIDISDCAIEKGQFRCDVNVSIRPKGSRGFGNRVEIKNMASFRFIADAIAYEVKRQADALASGEPILQETRLFDEARRVTLPMRGKEDAPDYRYFADPDLLEVELDLDFVEKTRASMPELPEQKIARIIGEYGLSKSDARMLTRDPAVSEYFAECAKSCDDKKRLGRFIVRELFSLLHSAGVSMRKCPVKPAHLAALVNMVTHGELTDAAAGGVLKEMFSGGAGPEAVMQKRDYAAIHDTEKLDALIKAVIDEHPAAVAQIRRGDAKPLNFLIGQVVRKSQGKADAKKVQALIEQRLQK
jgi:aspartyl-tRNA(Asn)/glutamyl-tRNA(Gln) amidotransferase subunit B